MPRGENEERDAEIITDVSEGGDAGSTRRIRVYDKKHGDFVLEIPSEAKVTFGYFNPATPNDDRYGHQSDNRRTALRIYRTEKHQLAVFLGVEGFRDLSLKLTRLTQRVTIESNFEDDGDGTQKWGGMKQLAPGVVEEEPIF